MLPSTLSMLVMCATALTVYGWLSFMPCRKYHIIKYEVVANSPLLHHGVAYSCDATKAAAVRKLPSMGPYDRFKHDMLCEQFYMVSRFAVLL